MTPTTSRVHWQLIAANRVADYKTRPDERKLFRHPTEGPTPELSQVTVVNPAPGAAPRLSYQHARRYVRQGRAEWVKGSPAIRFLDSHHAHASASRLAFRTQTAAGYDSRGMITLPELQRIPVVLDAVRLLIQRKRI